MSSRKMLQGNYMQFVSVIFLKPWNDLVTVPSALLDPKRCIKMIGFLKKFSTQSFFFVTYVYSYIQLVWNSSTSNFNSSSFKRFNFFSSKKAQHNSNFLLCIFFLKNLMNFCHRIRSTRGRKRRTKKYVVVTYFSLSNYSSYVEK